MRLRGLLFAVILLLKGIAYGQISQGGKPLEVSSLKSAEIPIVDMPLVNNKVLKSQMLEEQDSSPKLKPFRFAQPFEVSLSPKNSGEWVTASDGTKVWRLKIRSKGAYSLNLIFDQFKLPEGSRLFLYNEKENHTLGAFTSFNNKSTGMFAVLPVAGDEVTVQYEVPFNEPVEQDFVITQVNHDFIGILKFDPRRPLDELPGACNIDVNCGLGKNWSEIKDAVCRLIVNGKEICSGTLVNNTAENQKPYVLSAAHCYDRREYANTTLYTFNYESPYCAPLDGDPSNTISGAVLKAQYDSLDFALAELSLVPPPEFRPFYAGWDRSGNLPDSTVSIHHPQGHLKKIAIDKHKPEFSSYNSHYTNNGFIKILRWDYGVTESGSSGGGLFNQKKQLVGTLTGGIATCSNPVKDYFARFDMAWDFKSDSTKQLKYWLDPLKSTVLSIEGKRFYSGEDTCQAFTHLTDGDKHQNVPIVNSGQFQGYWGGTNSFGITGFVEKFSIDGNEQLHGISLGVGKVLDAPGGADSEISIRVYNGNDFPEKLIYSQNVSIKNLVADAMNFIGFNEMVEPAETFFIGFELSNMQPADTFVVYQSKRNFGKDNFFYYKKGSQWYNFSNANPDNYSMVNVFELVACNIEPGSNKSDTSLVDDPLKILVYPNPTKSAFILESGKQIVRSNISVFNLIGQQVHVKFGNQQNKKIEIDLSGNVPGVYFVRYNNGRSFVTQKVSFVPW